MNPNYVNPAPLLSASEQARAVAANLASGTANAITAWLGGLCPVQPAPLASKVAALTMHPYAVANIDRLNTAAVGTFTCLVTVPGDTVVHTCTFTGRQDFDCLRAFLEDSFYSKVTAQIPGTLGVIMRLAEVDYMRAILAESGAALPNTCSVRNISDTVQPRNGSSPEIDPDEHIRTIAENGVAMSLTHDVHTEAGPVDPNRPQRQYPLTRTTGTLTSPDPQGGPLA